MTKTKKIFETGRKIREIKQQRVDGAGKRVQAATDKATKQFTDSILIIFLSLVETTTMAIIIF